jgi:SAM-dependent methyltransferase
MTSAFAYDRVNYPSLPFRDTRPEHLELVGWLLGVAPRPAAEARVLEIGCASGGNLMPLAEQFPAARLVGIDLAESQIAEGRAIASAVGLGNVELHHLDLMQLDDRFGDFDYIIAHGLYSWVPEPVREGLLALIRARLAPAGIALVSHNVKPGYQVKSMARDMMRYAVRDIDEPARRAAQARAFLDTLIAGAREDQRVYRALLAQELEEKLPLPDEVLLHDDLGEICEGTWFHEFAARLEAHGLKYLADARLATNAGAGLRGEVPAMVARLAKSLVDREQLLDFFTNRRFRTTLMCHAAVRVDRALSPARLQELHVALNPERTPPAADPLVRAALAELGAAWPRPLPFPEICARAVERIGGSPDAPKVAATLAQVLFAAFLHGDLELERHAPRFTTRVGERPRATALARHLAPGGAAPTLRHATAELDEAQRQLLPLCDGSRDAAALAAATGLDLPRVETVLRQLAGFALLLA